MIVYAAGGTDSEWRQRLMRRWPLHTVIDPFEHSRQDGIYAFTNDDLGWIDQCGLVFGYCTYHRYTGMALEFGYAHAKGKPIVYVCGQPRIDSMMVGVADAAFTQFEAAVEFAERKWRLL